MKKKEVKERGWMMLSSCWMCGWQMEAKKELTLPNKRTACIFVIAINDLEKANTCDSTACL